MISLSVVICTYNKADILFGALKSLCDQTASKDKYEVIVVYNASSDNTEEVSRGYHDYLHIVYTFEPREGLSYARNRAIDIAQAEYIEYIDDDIRVSRDWVATALSIVKEINPDILGGPYFPIYDCKKPKWFLDKYATMTWGPYARYLYSDEYPHGGNIIIKKKLLKNLGGFNQLFGMKPGRLEYGEETEFVKRARNLIPSIKIYYSPNLTTYHLIRKEKMALLWLIRSDLRSIKTSIYLAEPSRLNKITYFNLISNIFYQAAAILEKIIFGIPFRNRQKYPYWQSYFMERIRNNFGHLFDSLSSISLKLKKSAKE